MNFLSQDVRFALRQLRKSPAFAVAAVLTLSIGIGASAAIFSVVDGVLLKPLPYPHAEQLVSLDITSQVLNPSGDPALRGMAPEDYFIFREQSRTFQGVGIYAETDSDNDVNVTGFAEPERVPALRVTDAVLPILGASPLYGRIFSRSDDSPGAPSTAVLSYSYWQRRFASNPSAVGKTIVIDGVAREIIGVLPRSFRFFEGQDVDLILPLQLDRNKVQQGNFSYFGVGRLIPGITIAQADSDIERMLPGVLDSFPPPPGISADFFKNSKFVPSLMPLKQDVVGNVGTLLWVLMGGIGMVLLIACANVANLLLVRTEGRRQELALRAALGATRGRVAALLLCQSAMLALIAAIFGIGLAWAGLRLLLAFAPAGLPRINDIRIDVPVLLFALAIALLTSLLFGLVPVLKYGGINATQTENARSLTQTRERHRARNVLVVVQVAFAFVLLISSGLMIRTFRALTHVNPGFVRPGEVQTFRIAIPPTDVPDNSAVVRAEQQIQDRIAATPGVSSVAFSSSVPLDGDNTFDNVFAADHPLPEGSLPPLRHLVFIAPGYLRTLGIPLIAGRDISWADTFNRVPVALISANFAREYWRTPDEALGKLVRISGNDDWRQIVGVVGDVHDVSLGQPARTDVYWPVLLAKFQGNPVHVTRYATFIVRSPLAGTASLMNQVRQVVWSVNANLPLASARTLGYLSAKSMSRNSFTLVMLGIAAAMALLLGIVGLYGVIAYSVSRRTREIGIRIALGSQRGDVTRLILSEGSLLVAIGLGLGVVGSFGSTRFLSSLLFGVTTTDPLTFAGVFSLLALIALAACYVPARRAAKVDPMVALRYE